MAMTVRALRGTMNEFTAMSLLFTQSTFRCCPQGELQRQRCHKSHERPHPRVGLHRRDLHSEPEAAEKFLIAFSTRAAFRGPSAFIGRFLTEPKRFAQDLQFREGP